MTISIYQQYDIFELFETKNKIDTYETANYFSTGEGEFKALYNNGKRLFTPH